MWGRDGEGGEEGGEGVGLVERCIGGPFVEKGDAEIEVGERGGSEGFDKDVDHNVGVVQVWVELIPAL